VDVRHAQRLKDAGLVHIEQRVCLSATADSWIPEYIRHDFPQFDEAILPQHPGEKSIAFPEKDFTLL
jgi:hypothetical protein